MDLNDFNFVEQRCKELFFKEAVWKDLPYSFEAFYTVGLF